MKLRKVSVMLLIAVMAMQLFTSTVYAATYCDRNVGTKEKPKQCGKVQKWKEAGTSVTHDASHKYGGVAGFFQKTCNYKYYTVTNHLKCSSNHVEDIKKVRVETGHDC